MQTQEQTGQVSDRLKTYPAQRKTCSEILDAARLNFGWQGASDLFNWVDVESWIDNGYRGNMIARMKERGLVEINDEGDRIKLTPTGYNVGVKYYEETFNKSFFSAMAPAYANRSRQRGI